VNSLNQQHVNHENIVSDNDQHYDIATPMESMTLKYPRSPAAPATRPLLYRTSASSPPWEPRAEMASPRIARSQGPRCSGMSDGRGERGRAQRGRAERRRAAEPQRHVPDAADSRTQPVQAKVTVPAKGESGGNREVGGGRSKRHDIVRDVMRQHGLSLPAASEYVKEHGLYCR
jgi:hypothetical protein